MVGCQPGNHLWKLTAVEIAAPVENLASKAAEMKVIVNKQQYHCTNWWQYEQQIRVEVQSSKCCISQLVQKTIWIIVLLLFCDDLIHIRTYSCTVLFLCVPLTAPRCPELTVPLQPRSALSLSDKMGLIILNCLQND